MDSRIKIRRIRVLELSILFSFNHILWFHLCDGFFFWFCFQSGVVLGVFDWCCGLAVLKTTAIDGFIW